MLQSALLMSIIGALVSATGRLGLIDRTVLSDWLACEEFPTLLLPFVRVLVCASGSENKWFEDREHTMAQFDEKRVRQLFESNLEEATARLTKLSFCCCESPAFQGLSGWVFEHTIWFCLREELAAVKIQATIRDQVSLGGKVRADLLIGTLVAIELKARGIFGKADPYRYAKYKAAAEKKDYSYLYITLQETYRPYREAMQQQLGNESAFFLDVPGEWIRLLQRIAQEFTKGQKEKKATQLELRAVKEKRSREHRS
jgi:hypothetical protein